MNQPTLPGRSTAGEPSEPDASLKLQTVCVPALLNAAATLGAAVMVVAMSGPKLPPYQGD